MKIYKLLILFFLYFPILSFANTYNEEENLFQVQLIFISHNSSNYIDFQEELISDFFISKSNVDIKINNCLINEDNNCVKFENDYKLDNFNSYAEILKKDKEITILNHIEWIQNFNNDLFIKIKSGEDYSEDIFDNKLDLQDINIIGSGKITKYEGTINFSKNRFYEIQVNLFERMKMKPPGFFSTDILTSKNYQIKQKIKLGKINYIDRDNFGMIIRVKKVKNF